MAGYAPSDMTKPISEFCCSAAPPVLEFDPEGNLVRHWGAPGAGYEWPPSMHGITIDGKDNVWLAGNGGHTILKFSKDGKFLLQIGKNGASKGNKDTANLNRPAEVEVDMAANEVYVADGYGNRRVIVYDADKGTFKRMWGAYGKPPTDDPNVHLRSGEAAVDQLADGALRVAGERRSRLRLRPRERSHPGVPQGRHVHQGSADCQADARRRRDLRHRVLEGSAAAVDVCG